MKLYMTISFSVMILLGAIPARAFDTIEYRAISAEDTGGTAELASNENILFGLSCMTGRVAYLPNLGRVSIGDTITHEEHSFRVGIIKASKYLEDWNFNGQLLAKKGDVQCFIAADYDALPGDDDCEALWVIVPQCRPGGLVEVKR